MKIKEYQIIVAGSGASGLFVAYKLAKRKDFSGRILIITKSPFGESNSRYAQGGIAAAIKSNTKDSIPLHISDTIKSGSGLCDENTVKFITEQAENTINELSLINAGFDRKEDGIFEYALCGGHSAKRVLHSGEDATGMVMINALTEAVKNCPNIDIMPRCTLTELIISPNNECEGVILFNNTTKEHELIKSGNIILATGGCGQIYKYTTNPYGATGDGVALAYLSGAEIQDIEFIQFHPTALVLNSETKNRYLISEAMRGEGAKLVNNNGEEFMQKYSSQKELAQRDIVTRAIISELRKENATNVFLDATEIDSATLLKRFPSIARKCKQGGIDITKDLIPVAPAAHYMIGGIKSDANGNTSIKGLYAIGETASTGFHGANRLASNSLLECVVCASNLAIEMTVNKNISINEKQLSELSDKYKINPQNNNIDFNDLKNRLKEVMWNKAGIIKNEKSLSEALNEINKLKSYIEGCSAFSSLSAYEFRNMVVVSELITKCALNRKESRGAHYRSDCTQTQDIPKHSIIRRN